MPQTLPPETLPDIQSMLPGCILGDVIPGIRMTDDTHSRVISKDSAEPGSGRRGPICNDYHTRMNTITHAYASSMMKTYPAGAARCIDQGIQQRPVGYGIAAILHRFRLPVGTG